MEESTKLNQIERESNKHKSKVEPPIDIDLGETRVFIHFNFYLTMYLGGDTCFFM